MAEKKKELNHAECIDRDLGEWESIFSISLRAYGWRVDRYKGKQKLVYIPDMIDGTMVCFLSEKLSGDFAVICNKRLWEKLAKHPSMDKNRILTAIAFLKHPEAFPEECADHVLHYVKSTRNRKGIMNEIIQEDDPEALIAYVLTVIITSKNKMFTIKELDKLSETVEKASKITPFLSEWDQNKVKESIISSQWYDHLTLPQIEVFIRLAQENNAVSVLAWLLDYKYTKFKENDPMEKYLLVNN